jgi:hypothetical protein
VTDVLDLSDSLPSESFTLEMINPKTKQPSGWKIEIAGPQHPSTVAIAAEAGRDILEEERAIRAAQASGQKFEPIDETIQVRRRKNVGRVCRRIIGWSPNPTFKHIQSAPIEFSVGAATDLFLRPEIAGFFVQITNYINSEKAFMQPSDQV